MARSTIIGVAQLDAALRVRAALLSAAVDASVSREVEAVRSDAVGLAPEKDGVLKDSITGKADGASGQVKADARHAAFQEFGTTRNAAQPYMAPAAATSRQRFVGRVALAARKAVT